MQGFPHSDIDGSVRAYCSPSRFAVCCVLLRQIVPRHSPYALSSLTTCELYLSIFFFQNLVWCSTLKSLFRLSEKISLFFLSSNFSLYRFVIFSFQCSLPECSTLKTKQYRRVFLAPQKGGDPSPRSRRDTLLRLHPNHRSHLRQLPPYGQATGFGCYQLSWCDGRCVQGPRTYSPQYG